MPKENGTLRSIKALSMPVTMVAAVVGALIGIAVSVSLYIGGINADLEHVAAQVEETRDDVRELTSSYNDRLGVVEACCQRLDSTITGHLADHPDRLLRRTVDQLREEWRDEHAHLREMIERLIERGQ